jgi:hypothetical protein
VLENGAKEKQEQEMVTLDSLSSLTGFPVKLIKEELFSDSLLSDGEVSLEALRLAMMNYLDQTMLIDEETSA